MFKLMSRLIFNYKKSTIITWSSRGTNWGEGIVRSIGYTHSKVPIKYLGLSIGENMRREKAWVPILEKIWNKLFFWKARLLSRAGKLTFIKSVLNSFPIYYMIMFRVPKIIAKKITSLQRKFF